MFIGYTDRIKKFFKEMDRRKKIILAILLFITILGGFLRLYRFSDWLHFELDQSRDIMFVSEGISGNFFDLPILGPKASGTTLHLGPAYYHMEYLSALVFGDNPVGHALFVPILSIISIPLFFLFSRRFFNDVISLGLSYLYSISVYFILYARFSWNPNVLPFFILASFYCFFRATEKKSSHPGIWWVAFGFFISVSTQLHFVSFLIMPLFFLIAVVVKRPHFSWKVWSAFFVMIFFVYSPVLVAESFSGGANTRAFFEAVSKRGSSKSAIQKIADNSSSEARAYALLLSGEDHIFLPKLKFKGLSVKTDCGDHCKETPAYLAFSVVAFFIVGMAAFFYRMIRYRKDFLVMGGWFFSVFLIFTILSSELAPRFYLLLIPLPFLFLGLIIDIVWKRKKILAQIVFVIIILILSWSNWQVIRTRFLEYGEAPIRNISSSADHILEEPIRVTLEQQEIIADYFKGEYEKNRYPVFLDCDPTWARSIRYLTEKKGIPVAEFSKTVYLHGNSFIIVRSKKGISGKMKTYVATSELREKKEFGTLTVYVLSPNPETAKGTDPKTPSLVDLISGDRSDVRKALKSGTVRVTWRDIWSLL